MANREILLMSIFDENIITIVDDGVYNKEGAPRPGRRRLMRTLETKSRVDVNGKRVPIQVFALAKAPAFSDPEFDADYLMSGGVWSLPDENYLKLREANITKTKARNQAAAQVAADIVAKDISHGLKELVRSSLEMAEIKSDFIPKPVQANNKGK